MADSLKDKAKEVGHTISEAAAKAGHVVAETAEKVTDWAKDKLHQAGQKADKVKQKAGRKISAMAGSTGKSAKKKHPIRKHMDVIASCGKKVGVVDRVQGTSIKLTKKDSPGGQHHRIPQAWVDHVDTHVHLTKNSAETEREWQAI